MKYRKTIAKLLLLSFILGILPLNNVVVNRAASSYGISNPVREAGVTTWDCIYFGNYAQSDSTGVRKEPVKWRVLSVNGDDAFLLADKNLDVHCYNETSGDVTWETSGIRDWLNSVFIKGAFSLAEQRAIRNTKVVNLDNPQYGSEGGNDTQDKVYLPSIEEVMNTGYGFEAGDEESDTRVAVNTAYVAAGGSSASGEMEPEDESDFWWLRSSGDDNCFAANTDFDGSVNMFGIDVCDSNFAVRPVLHLDLSETAVWKLAGKVDSEGKVSDPVVPDPTAGPTEKPDVSLGGKIDIISKKNASEGCTVALPGTFTLGTSTEVSKEKLQRAIDSLKFESSDNSKAKVLHCEAVQSKDDRLAELKIWVTLYNKGTATITATAADGHTSKCEITITESTSTDNENYEGDYTGEMREFVLNKGTQNTLKYLCTSSNFSASTFVAEKDAKFGNLLVMALTDTYYRGWDGWKDLIDGSTSVEEAEKIIASLLNAYQGEVEGLSMAKTAQKYAKMINNAFLDYTKSTNMFEALNSEEIQVVRKYFSDENLTKMLYEGKYDEIVSPVNQILQQEGMNQIVQKSEVFQAGTEASKSWNKMMDGFAQSAEMSNIAKKGCQKKLGILEVGGGLKDIGTILEVASFAQDTLNYLYRLESLLMADEMYCEMLLYLQENCPYSVVQEAAGNLYSVINDGVNGIISDVVKNAMNLGGEMVLDKSLDIACKACVPLSIIKAGFDWGVTLSNTFFKVGTTQELKDSLRIQAFLANTLGRWAISKEMEYLSAIGTNDEALKAKELYYSLYMVWESRKCAEEALQSLLKTTGGEWSANYSVSTRISSTLESFKDNIFSKENMAGLFGISVSCPVDVEIFNAVGNKLLTVKDGIECGGYENGIYYYCVYNPLSGDYDKYIYYSEDLDYNVRILGNDLGSVDASVLSVNDNGYLNEFYVENTEIEKGTVIDLGNISKEGVGYRIISSDGSQKSETMNIRTADKIATRSILLSQESLELKTGEKQLLAVSFAPANATNQKVVWNSSNEAIVSVNSDGVITAIAPGTAVVTVSQGDFEQTCKVTVKGENAEYKNENNPEADRNESGNLVSIQNTEIFLKDTVYVYNGKKKQPSVIVNAGSKKLIQGTDYTITYANNQKVGTASLIVNGIGKYTGRQVRTFKIIPKGTSISKVAGKSKGFTVRWKKQSVSVDGYRIQYSTSKKFVKKSTVEKTIKKISKTKLKVKKCKAKKKYYVRICTYKTVKGKKYYSAWSKVGKVMIK